MTQIEARFRHGKFEPLTPVNFREDAILKLNVEDPTESRSNNPSEEEDLEWTQRVRKIREQIKEREGESLKSWLEDIRAMHAEFLKERGPLPDSTLLIAEDRMR